MSAVPDDHLRHAIRQPARMAVFGLGRWGCRLLEAFDRQCRVDVAVSRGGAEGRAWLSEHLPHIRHTTDPTEVFADPDIDAVAIATPIASHRALAIDALAAGKHVFVEKPLATTTQACDEVIAAAADRGRTLFVGYVFVYDAEIERLHARTREDAIVNLELVWRKLGTFGEPLIWNLLTHQVAVAVRLMGADVQRHRIVEARADRTELDRLRVRLEFGDGRSCTIEVDRTRPHRENRMELVTASGQRLDWSDAPPVAVRPASRPGEAHAGDRPLDREVAAFLRSMADGRPAVSDGRFAREVTRIVEAIGADPQLSSLLASAEAGS